MSSDLVADVLAHAPVFDGHNDLPYALHDGFAHDVTAAHLDEGQPALHTDIPALRQGGVGAQFWSVYVSSKLPPASAVGATLEQIDCVVRLAETHPDTFRLARTAADVRAAMADGRIASLMGMEGGHSIDSSLAVLRQMRRLGVAYMTLTHNDNTPWAASATGDEVDFGLTEFGREVVAEMNRIGMLVDLSHVHARTMHDALDVTTAPVIFSHSSCRAITDHARDVPDDVLERLSGNGGVLMLTFVPSFVSQAVVAPGRAEAEERERLGLGPGRRGAGGADEAGGAAGAFAAWQAAHPAPRATVADVVAHVEHAREVVGPRHLGLGGDFDGVESLPVGLERVSDYPVLLEALAERGWGRGDLAALTSGNILRVLEAVAG